MKQHNGEHCGKSTVDGSYVKGVYTNVKGGNYVNGVPVHPWSVGIIINIEPETGKNKPFIVANVREILDLMESEEITFSRGVEMFNEVAEKYYSKVANPMGC